MSLTAADIHGVLSGAFPAKAPRASLEYVETVTRPTGGFAVVVRLVVYNLSSDGTTGSLRDVKEQAVPFNPYASSFERLTAYAAALVHVVSQALANVDTDQLLMPRDFFIANVLKLSKVEAYPDFVKALSAKSRIGKHLPVTADPET